MRLKKAFSIRKKERDNFLKIYHESEDVKEIYTAYKKYKKSHDLFLKVFENSPRGKEYAKAS